MSAAGYLRHFQACNKHDLTKFAPFTIGAKQVGWVTKELAALLPLEMDFFRPHKNGIALAPYLDSFSARSDALAAAAGWISARSNQPLRKEMYPVLEKWGDKPLAQIDRQAVPWFGVKAFGVHVNGFTRKKDGIYLWVGERAKDRQIDPDKLDNLIGGGQPIGLSIEDNLIKEAKEEAGIDAALARTAKQVRVLEYMCERQGGLRNDALFLFDLELPDGYTPRNTDGEVAAFHLMSLSEVAEIIRTTDRFKFNCNMVIIDFLMRHGSIEKTHPEYIEIRKYLPEL